MARKTPDSLAALLADTQWMRALALGLVRDPDAADELTQDAWVAALRRPPRSAESARGWFRTVAHNLVRQRARADSARAAREEERATEDPDPPAGDLIEEVENQRIVTEELLRLEEPYRSVVILRYFRGLSSSEIARRRKTPAATVRSQLSRGLAQLRAALDERYGGDRGQWSALCLAWALPELALPPVDPSPSSLPNGVLTMGTIAKLSLAAGIAVAAGIGWNVLRSPRAMEAGVAHKPELVPREMQPAQELTPLDEVLPVALPEPQRESLTREAPATQEEAPEPSAEEDPSFEDGLLTAAFVDAQGSPIPGLEARVHDVGGPCVGRTGFDGRIQLEVPMTDSEWRRNLVYAGQGYGRGLVSVNLRAGETTHAGTIQVSPGTSIAGIVLDERQQPVPGAVVLDRITGFAQDLDPGQLLRRGPGSNMLFHSEHEALEVECDGDGRFVLESVPVGSHRIWAHAEGMRHAASQVLEVHAGSPLQGVTIALEALRPEDMIEGIVIAPDGTPLGHQFVGFSFEDTGLGISSGFSTREDGTFRYVAYRTVPHTLSIDGKAGEWSPLRALDVEPGTVDLVLQLRRPRTFDLLVRSLVGEPVERFALTTVLLGGDDEDTNRKAEARYDQGLVELEVPEERFRIEVRAPGFRLGEVGPFEPDALPDRVECRLEALPGVRGRVLANGRPVGAAEVQLLRSVPSDQLFMCNGFRTQMEPSAECGTHSEANGTYLLSLRQSGDYYARVSHEDHAPTLVGPLRIDANEGLEELDIELGEGGTLLVRVSSPSGRGTAGTVVGISCGDARAKTKRVDEEGYARFEGLTLGRWHVSTREEELSPNFTTSSRSDLEGDDPPEVPWSCEVFEGRTTTYDLVLEE